MGHDPEKNRDAGSPEWQPIYQDGTIARFAAAQGDLAKPGGEGGRPHAWCSCSTPATPVVWWSYDLLTREPDWLREPRGPDVSPETRYFPIITFLQVTVDQFFGVSVPVGHGHNYPNTIVYAWENVVPPPDWTGEQSAALQTLISGEPAVAGGWIRSSAALPWREVVTGRVCSGNTRGRRRSCVETGADRVLRPTPVSCVRVVAASVGADRGHGRIPGVDGGLVGGGASLRVASPGWRRSRRRTRRQRP